MNITSFDNDLLDLRPCAERLQAFINTELQFVEGSLVIALSSKYGSGKTTFLQMWEADLGKDRERQNAPIVISVNAWESDYYGDPLFAVISGLADYMRKGGKSVDPIVDAAKDIGWFATAIGGQIAQKVTGIDPVAAGNLAEEKKARREGVEDIPKDTFSVYEGRKNAMCRLKEAVEQFVASSGLRVYFIIDELDRCRPDYAITYLETIKHVFDVKGAVFILAADRDQLNNSAKTAFGRDLDFDEYYRKFVHREVTLPPITDAGYNNIAKKYVDYYLQRDDIRNCLKEFDGRRIEDICKLIGGLRLTPRQIQEVFRILGYLFEPTENMDGRLKWCLAEGSIAMAAFKVGKPGVYRLLGTQQFEPKEAFAFLQDIFGNRRTERWFVLFLTGGGLKTSENGSLKEVMVKLGLIKEGDDPKTFRPNESYYNGWTDPSLGFKYIHDRIEQVLQWK